MDRRTTAAGDDQSGRRKDDGKTDDRWSSELPISVDSQGRPGLALILAGITADAALQMLQPACG